MKSIVLQPFLMMTLLATAQAEMSGGPVFCNFVFEEVGGESYWNQSGAYSAQVDPTMATMGSSQVIRPLLIANASPPSWAVCAEAGAEEKTSSRRITLHAFRGEGPMVAGEGCTLQPSTRYESARAARAVSPGQVFGVEFESGKDRKVRFSLHWLTKSLAEAPMDFCRKVADEMSSSPSLDASFSKLMFK